MPIVAVQNYLKGLLDGLQMPGQGVPALAAYITPRDPDVDAKTPKCYIWPLDGDEQRKPKTGGAMGRNTPGNPGARKSVIHQLGLWVVWFLPGGDPDSDILFPGMVDAIMNACRTAYPMPVIVTDPWTEQQSQVVNVGETMRYQVEPPHALKNQRLNRYDGLIRMPVTELIRA